MTEHRARWILRLGLLLAIVGLALFETGQLGWLAPEPRGAGACASLGVASFLYGFTTHARLQRERRRREREEFERLIARGQDR